MQVFNKSQTQVDYLNLELFLLFRAKQIYWTAKLNDFFLRLIEYQVMQRLSTI